jgi:uncharacterized C2H2 Zn-finger protein
MGSEEGDEHLDHHPVCEVCHKEFDDIHELSKHVNQEHRNQDKRHKSEKQYKMTEVKMRIIVLGYPENHDAPFAIDHLEFNCR